MNTFVKSNCIFEIEVYRLLFFFSFYYFFSLLLVSHCVSYCSVVSSADYMSSVGVIVLNGCGLGWWVGRWTAW